MRRDFSKKYQKNQQRSPALIVAVAILVGAIGLVGYEYKKHPESFPVASANITRLTSWMSHDKQASVIEDNSKSLAINEEPSEEQIHFEFYTTLPNIKMAATKSTTEQRLPTTFKRE